MPRLGVARSMRRPSVSFAAFHRRSTLSPRPCNSRAERLTPEQFKQLRLQCAPLRPFADGVFEIEHPEYGTVRLVRDKDEVEDDAWFLITDHRSPSLTSASRAAHPARPNAVLFENHDNRCVQQPSKSISSLRKLRLSFTIWLHSL